MNTPRTDADKILASDCDAILPVVPAYVCGQIETELTENWVVGYFENKSQNLRNSI